MGNTHRFFCGIYSTNSFTGASMKGGDCVKATCAFYAGYD